MKCTRSSVKPGKRCRCGLVRSSICAIGDGASRGGPRGRRSGILVFDEVHLGLGRLLGSWGSDLEVSVGIELPVEHVNHGLLLILLGKNDLGLLVGRCRRGLHKDDVNVLILLSRDPDYTSLLIDSIIGGSVNVDVTVDISTGLSLGSTVLIATVLLLLIGAVIKVRKSVG